MGRRPWRLAALLTLPYLLLGLAWLGTNPAAGGPDEDAHLIKALAAARLDIGTPGPPPTADLSPIRVRNASNRREVTVPGRLSPIGDNCLAFRPDVTAACQDDLPPRPSGDVRVGTLLGAYPPFLYPPMGLAASLGSTPYEAFLLARLVVLATTSLLLLLTAWHLVRWLGPQALLGVPLLLTPLAVSSTGTVSTSGIEIVAALLVAAVVTVAARRPASLRAPGTQLLLLLGGGLLVLSRQLGVVTMAALTVVLLALGGWRTVLDGLRRRSPVTVATVGGLAVCTVAATAWELRYDHPAMLGPWMSADGWAAWSGAWLEMARSGVGWFGWMETRMAASTTTAWLLAALALVVTAVVVGTRRDRVVLVGAGLALVALSSSLYVHVFWPVESGLQGRHVLPFAALLPVYAGVVVAERLGPRVAPRVVGALALALPALHAYGFVLYAVRDAVGSSAASWHFVAQASWSPVLGWYPWLGLGAAAVAGLVVSGLVLARAGRRDPLAASTLVEAS